MLISFESGHASGSERIRLLCGRGAEQSSPSLPGAMEFNFHMEQKKVLTGMTLANAIASFFHITFIDQLKYPPKVEAVAILLQRWLAKVNEEGKNSFLLSVSW